MTGFAISVILGIICARYRDIPPIVQSVMQVAFFLTPIFWRPQDLGGRAILIDFNPFHHYVEILRGPLMGYVAAPVSWVAVLVMMVFLLGVAVWLLRRVGGYIIFWL